MRTPMHSEPSKDFFVRRRAGPTIPHDRSRAGRQGGACSGNQRAVGVALPVLGCHQSWKHFHACLRDHEVMIAGAEALAATLDDAQAAPFASINRSELVEMDDAVRNAVNGLIGGLGGEIVKHDHGGVVLGEVVLEREDLAAVAQGALGQKPDLGQAVDHDTIGLQPLNGLEYPLDRFAELEIGGV